MNIFYANRNFEKQQKKLILLNYNVINDALMMQYIYQ